jgi:apolipoprotein D and lipocalin family protein
MTSISAGSKRTARHLPAIIAGLAMVSIALPSNAAFAGAAPLPTDGPAPVAQLDLQRYLGTWYQLAAVPQWFNLICARDSRAEYGLAANGDVTVRNSCSTWTGQQNVIRGTATVNDHETGAQLHVSFPDVPTQGERNGPTNYIVTALGADYSWALVTDPSRLSGFVLARNPALDAETWDRVRAAITAAGQNSCLYLTSPTTGGSNDITPLCPR